MTIPSAARAWAFLVGGALAYDLFAIHEQTETLSQWCSKHTRTTYVVGGYLLAHLVGRPRMMNGVDPLNMVARMLRKPLP